MNWQEVLEHPSLQDLPFKIELDEYGRVIMSPVKIYHSALQVKIAIILEQLLSSGVALSECAIKTNRGTKVADVAWVSSSLWNHIKTETVATVAPEICVEIISASNTQKELLEKSRLYFEAGAKEVWLCDDNGTLSFFNSQGSLIQSELAPAFPQHLEL